MMESKLEYKSILKNEIQDLVDNKRSVGYKYEAGALSLRRLDDYFVKIGLDTKELTRNICDSWCSKRSYETIGNQNSRISCLRVLCLYLNEIGIRSYIPPNGLQKHGPKYDSHIYSKDELIRFFNAVDQSKSVPSECPFRHLVMPLFFRILYTSGLRVSELRLAKIKDFDLEAGFLKVVSGKNNKDRLVPVHPSLVEKCIELKREIHSFSSNDEYFFMKFPGEPMSLGNIYKNFRRYLEKANISHTGKGPRVHDFRHTYCVNLLKKWIDEKKDLLVYLPYMKTMLGHESFNETAYYLKLTAELFPTIRIKLEKAYPDIIEEVELHEDFFN